MIVTDLCDFPIRLVTSLVSTSSPTYFPLINRISSPISIFFVNSAGCPALRNVILFPLYLRPKPFSGSRGMVRMYREEEVSENHDNNYRRV